MLDNGGSGFRLFFRPCNIDIKRIWVCSLYSYDNCFTYQTAEFLTSYKVWPCTNHLSRWSMKNNLVSWSSSLNIFQWIAQQSRSSVAELTGQSHLVPAGDLRSNRLRYSQIPIHWMMKKVWESNLSHLKAPSSRNAKKCGIPKKIDEFKGLKTAGENHKPCWLNKSVMYVMEKYCKLK